MLIPYKLGVDTHLIFGMRTGLEHVMEMIVMLLRVLIAKAMRLDLQLLNDLL